VRKCSDLAYGTSMLTSLCQDPYLGEMAREKLLHYACVSQEVSEHVGRVTSALASGSLCKDLGISAIDARYDRMMICGNLSMLNDTRALLDRAGFVISPQVGVCGDYVIERAFSESLARRAA